MLAYRALRSLLRFATGVFFRQIEVVGRENIAGEGERAVLFAGNHPNSLIDPVLILCTAGRIVRFAAKDVLFQSAFLRFFLHRLGAVPVARKADHGDGALDNRSAFTKLSEVLAGGGAMGIFPEGLSHDEAQLSKLKTGAARIALDVAHRYDQPIDVVPCGLTYVNPKRFRSRVLVQYGPPLQIGAAEVDVFLRDERRAVRELTARIDAALRGLTVNADDWATVRVLDGVRRLYQPAGITLWQRFELARRFNEAWPQVRHLPEVQAVATRVTAYQDRLAELGLLDRDVRRPMGLFEAAARMLGFGLQALVWMPLAAPGILLQAPVAACIQWAGIRFAPRKDVIATTKLVLGLLALPLVYAGLVALTAWQWDTTAALAVGVLLPTTGYAALRTLERGLQVKRLLATAVKMLALRREVADLRRERAELEDEVVRLVDRLKPKDLEPLFPRPLPLPAETGADPVAAA